MPFDQHLERDAGAALSPFAGVKAEPVLSPQMLNAVVPPVATALPTPAAAPIQAAVPQKAFGKMTGSEKASSLAQVMTDSAGTLKENGVSHHMEEMIAAVMMNEGGTNTRRVTLSNYFNGMMSDGKNGGLLGQLDKAGIEKLKSDPAALTKFEKGMGEDQRFMVQRALSGQLDLEGLNSDDRARKAAARDQVTSAGVDLRTQQYDEYTTLYGKQHDGTKLSKEEQARLTQLGNIGGHAMGFDGLDQRKGIGDATMKDVRGVSSDRFREIYEDSQVRFEPAHYRRWRDQYEQQTAANGKLPADKQKDIHLSSGIGDYTLNGKDKESLSHNYDLLADINTSYGAPQVMGLYGHDGELKAKDGKGQPIDFNIDRLKAASRRTNPNEEDVQLLLGELAGKGMDMGSKNLSAEVLTDKYNGDRKTNANWSTYVGRLKENVGTYQTAERIRDAKKPAAASPNAHFAE